MQEARASWHPAERFRFYRTGFLKGGMGAAVFSRVTLRVWQGWCKRKGPVCWMLPRAPQAANNKLGHALNPTLRDGRVGLSSQAGV